MKTTKVKCRICERNLQGSTGQKKLLKTVEECSFFSLPTNRTLTIGDVICAKCRGRAYYINRKLKVMSSNYCWTGTSGPLQISAVTRSSETDPGSRGSVKVSENPKKGKQGLKRGFGLSFVLVYGLNFALVYGLRKIGKLHRIGSETDLVIIRIGSKADLRKIRTDLKQTPS